MPPAWKAFFWIVGIATMLLFLTPAFFVGKYFALDAPREQARLQAYGDPSTSLSAAAGRSVEAALAWRSPHNIPFEAGYALKAPDPGVRLAAVQGLTASLTVRGAVWHPMEAMIGKSTLAQVAEQDKDPAVQSAARDGLEQVARGGAVVER
jgi:hypothetical protein